MNLLACLTFLFFPFLSFADAEPFRFHLLSEPQTLDPQTSSAASGNYLFHNIYRGLYRFDPKLGLVAEGAETCTRKGLDVICKLKVLKWSNGQPIRAVDYVNSFRRLIDPDMRSPQSDVLFSLQNARAIWIGKQKPESLGVEAEGELKLIFHLSEPDPEFEYKLIHPALTPLPPGGFPQRAQAVGHPINGPYKISKWQPGLNVKLEVNSFYKGGNPKRPAVEAYFIEDDSTALRLFETGKLSFNRRLVASEIPRFKRKPGFYQIPMARFDYIGFGPRLLPMKEVREALVKGIEFQDFLKVFDTQSPAGCPSLPRRLMSETKCLQPDFPQAVKLLTKNTAPVRLRFEFSKMGGDDVARGAEWFQGQWKKNLSLSVELASQEQGVYLRRLKVDPPDLFRKGVSLDRPTCLAALEIFLKDHPENFIRLDDAGFAQKVEKLRTTKSEDLRKKFCGEAVEYLMSLNRLIPLGEMFFTVIADPRYTGWTLNELNQLDLASLSRP